MTHRKNAHVVMDGAAAAAQELTNEADEHAEDNVCERDR